MSTILEETRFLMDRYHIQANKSLGQNFLINQEVVDHIIEGSQVTKEDLVIEIGPGLGTLTKYLLERAGKVICIELDPKMIAILQDRFSLDPHFELMHEDVLKVNLKKLIQKEKVNKEIKKVKIVANLPYYITTPIIMKLLEDRLDLESITVMIQKEVADRLIALPGKKDTGAITYSVAYYATSQAILEVPNSSFIPEPEVTSKVIKLTIRKEAPVKVKNEEVFFRLIKSAFMQRRKTLLNALTNARVFSSKQEATCIFEELRMKENARAEELTLEDFAHIANQLVEK